MSIIKSLKRTFGFIHKHPLAKKYLFKSYFKFFYWQIKSRTSNKFFQINFIGGTKFWAKKRMAGVTGNIYTGLHEFEEMSFLLHFLREDDIFFDVGSNVGGYTILAAGVSKAYVVAFEPIKNTFNILQKNITLNQLNHKVKEINSGVGKEEGYLFFTSNQDTTNHIVEQQQAGAISIPIVSLNNYYPTYQPSLIKIDVEGYETEVLNGATQILKDQNLKAIIVELNGCGERYGFKDQHIHEQLLSFLFLPYQYNPFSRILTPLAKYNNINTIYVRDLLFVNNRLKNAKPFKVFGEII